MSWGCCSKHRHSTRRPDRLQRLAANRRARARDKRLIATGRHELIDPRGRHRHSVLWDVG